MSKPLDGVRVLEAANFVFAPAAAAILGEWGAEVIKVEPLTGDPARMVSAWGVPALVDGVAHLFEMVNRDKCSISIQLAEPEGRELFLRLVDTAGVFITNFL